MHLNRYEKFYSLDRRMEVSEFLNLEREDDLFEEISASVVVKNFAKSVQGPVEGDTEEDLQDSDSVLPSLSEQKKYISLAKLIVETLLPGEFGVIRGFRKVQNFSEEKIDETSDSKKNRQLLCMIQQSVEILDLIVLN